MRSQASRERLPTTRRSLTHKFRVGQYEGYVTAGMYEDGSLGEVFLTDLGKEGSFTQGVMAAYATTLSVALQYGVPLEVLVRKYAHVRFEPGPTGNEAIGEASSIIDYLGRWLALHFGTDDLRAELGLDSNGGHP